MESLNNELVCNTPDMTTEMLVSYIHTKTCDYVILYKNQQKLLN